MYEAKEAGRNGFALYKPPKGTPPRASSRLMEAKRVREALEHDRLELYCQPILNLRDNQVSQYELLVRLRSERGEMLLPSALLYVAERFGTILALDSWVVQQAITLIAEQERAGHTITLSVNVSGKSIGNGHLVRLIDRALNEAGVDPTRLVFELTETAAIGNIENAKAFTSHLRDHGCQFALDDLEPASAPFTTSNSSPSTTSRSTATSFAASVPTRPTSSWSKPSSGSRRAWARKPSPNSWRTLRRLTSCGGVASTTHRAITSVCHSP
jgi:predicted signal transduction protein with EAL and GGDEF domain